MGSVGSKSQSTTQYDEIIQRLTENKAHQSNLRMDFYVKREESYVGDSNVQAELYKAFPVPKGYTVDSIDSDIISDFPDKDGYAQVYARYTISKQAYTGGRDLGSGRAQIKRRDIQSRTGLFRVKVLDI